MVGFSPSKLNRVLGDQWDFGPFQHKDSTGTPLNLTGYIVTAKLRQNNADLLAIATVLASSSDDRTGILWLDATIGKYMIKVTEADSANVKVGVCQLVVRVTDPQGNIRTKASVDIEVFKL